MSARARAASPARAKALIQQVVETVGDGAEKHIDRLAWRIGFGNTAKLSVLGVALVVGGYLAGQWRVEAAQTALAEGSSFFAQMAALNDGSAMLRFCREHSFEQGGGTACNLPPVWVRRKQ